jgi:AhpD family alkylhydroperoxidase
MPMLDWNTYRQQLVAGVGGFGKLNPDIVRGYATLSRDGQKAGYLDEKTRELVALAVAITLHCDGCITVHTAAAGSEVRARKKSPKCWAWRFPSMPAPPSSIPPARSTHSTPPPKSIPTPEENS